jgi:putative transposase
MQVQRTITILLEDDRDLRETLHVSQMLKNAVSTPCYNKGKPLGFMALHRQEYRHVCGSLNSQMTQSAMRQVAASYTSAKSNGRPATEPFVFKKPACLFMIGPKGRDASFIKGKLSLWTVAGRKKIGYHIPRHDIFEKAVDVDCLTVIERNGELIGRLVVTLEFPDAIGVLPVGIDLNETNALVASDPDGKVRNKKSFKTRKRLQKKLAARKAQKQDTHSVRRLLKRLGRKRSNRTKTFAQTAAKRLCQWSPMGSVLVFEALNIPQVSQKFGRSRALRRRLSQWQKGLIRQFTENKAPEFGHVVDEVDPRYTSQLCHRCGLIGKRKRHQFVCPNCGHTAHADVNASLNIRDRYTVFRSAERQKEAEGSGVPSVTPEVLVEEAHASDTEGKLSALDDSH